MNDQTSLDTTQATQEQLEMPDVQVSRMAVEESPLEKVSQEVVVQESSFLEAQDLSQLFQPDWIQSKDAPHALWGHLDGEGASGSFKGSQKSSRFKKKFSKKRGFLEGKDDSYEKKKPPFLKHSKKEGRPFFPKNRGSEKKEKKPSKYPPRPPASSLVGWNIFLSPEPLFLKQSAQKIKSELKAYPLFELVRLMLAQSHRYHLLIQKEEKSKAASAVTASSSSGSKVAPTPLWAVKLDGDFRNVWESRRDAVAYLLKQHRDRWYRVEKISVDPPKGAFPCVVRSQATGKLLGPPNYHGYQSAARRLYQEHFKHLPWEKFLKGLERVHDPEVIAQWQQEVSTQEVYYPLAALSTREEKVNQSCLFQSEVEVSGNSELLQDSPSLTVEMLEEEQETSQEESCPESSVQEGEGVSQQDVVEENLVEQDLKVAIADSRLSEEESAQKEESTSESPQVGEKPEDLESLDANVLKSYTELEQHFLKEYADQVIELVDEEVLLTGSDFFEAGSGEVRLFLENLIYEWNRFPLILAQSLGQELTKEGLAVFKAHGKILYIGVARPSFHDSLKESLSDSLRRIIEYIEQHPKEARQDQWKGLLQGRSESTQPEKEKGLAQDLAWLFHQGYLIHFAMGNLEIVRPRRDAFSVKEKDATTASIKKMLVKDTHEPQEPQKTQDVQEAHDLESPIDS